MKTLLTVALVAVAVVAPEIIPLAFPALGLLATAAITAAVEVGVGLAFNAFVGPATPKGINQAVANQKSRLNVTMDTTAPRKIFFGAGSLANDVRMTV